jgi:hypothetical protein
VNCLECSSDISFSLCTNTAFLDLQTRTPCFIFFDFFFAQQISHIQLRILLDTLLKGRYTLIDSSITDRFVRMFFCYNLYFDFCYKVTCAGCSLCTWHSWKKKEIWKHNIHYPCFLILTRCMALCWFLRYTHPSMFCHLSHGWWRYHSSQFSCRIP